MGKEGGAGSHPTPSQTAAKQVHDNYCVGWHSGPSQLAEDAFHSGCGDGPARTGNIRHLIAQSVQVRNGSFQMARSHYNQRICGLLGSWHLHVRPVIMFRFSMAEQLVGCVFVKRRMTGTRRLCALLLTFLLSRSRCSLVT